MEFNSHIIYYVHIEEQNQVIRIKDLYIFKDTENKKNIFLLFYENESIFQDFLSKANDDKEKKKKSVTPTISQVTPLNNEGILLSVEPPATTLYIGYIVKSTPKTKDKTTMGTLLLSYIS